MKDLTGHRTFTGSWLWNPRGARCNASHSAMSEIIEPSTLCSIGNT